MSGMKIVGSKKIRKYIFIFVIVIVLIVMPCILQYAIHYYFHPVKSEVHIFATGRLIYNLNENDYETVQVEIKGENLRYVYHNNEEGIQGDIWVNGYSIFGHGTNLDEPGMGFFSEFYDDSNYTCAEVGSNDNSFLCKIIAVSKDWSTIVCGVTVDSNISNRVEGNTKEDALLVITADNPDTDSFEIIKETVSNSKQMNDWLIKHGWIE